MWLVAPWVKRKTPLGPLQLLGTIEVARVQVRLADGSLAIGAHVADDHPHADALRERWMQRPDAQVLADGAATPADAPAAVPAPEPPHVQLQARARRNGWSDEDLVGTWDGVGDELAVRSPVTGLSLVEMAQTVAPADWETIRPTGFAPWSSSQWRAPRPGWTAPAWTVAKTHEEAPVVPVPDGTPAEDDESPTEVWETVHEDDPTTISEEPAAVVEAVALDYPDDARAQAHAVLLALYTEFSRVPSLGKANNRLVKAGLPRVHDTHTLQWLLEQP